MNVILDLIVQINDLLISYYCWITNNCYILVYIILIYIHLSEKIIFVVVVVVEVILLMLRKVILLPQDCLTENWTLVQMIGRFSDAPDVLNWSAKQRLINNCMYGTSEQPFETYLVE